MEPEVEVILDLDEIMKRIDPLEKFELIEWLKEVFGQYGQDQTTG